MLHGIGSREHCAMRGKSEGYLSNYISKHISVLGNTIETWCGSAVGIVKLQCIIPNSIDGNEYKVVRFLGCFRGFAFAEKENGNDDGSQGRHKDQRKQDRFSNGGRR